MAFAHGVHASCWRCGDLVSFERSDNIVGRAIVVFFFVVVVVTVMVLVVIVVLTTSTAAATLGASSHAFVP